MGLFSMFTVDAEYIRGQSTIDAARIKQTASNAAQRSIIDSKYLVQRSNNAASTSYAAAQRRVQAANNSAETRLGQVADRLQGARNAVGSSERMQRLKVQATYNDQAIKVNEAKKELQAARNARAASNTALANFGTSIANKEIMRQAGHAINDISDELGRSIAGATSGRAYERLQNAEMMGASVAALSVAGVGSSFIQQFNSAMDLRQALKDEASDRETNARSVMAGRAKGEVLYKMGGSLQGYQTSTELDREVLIPQQNYDAITDESSDFSPIFANQDYTFIDDVQDFEVYSPQIDYTVYEDRKKMGAFQKIATGIGTAVATYYGGPAAGQAVMNASMAYHTGRNGDYPASAAYSSQAVANSKTGFKTWRAAGTNTTPGKSWGGEQLAKAGVYFKIGK